MQIWVGQFSTLLRPNDSTEHNEVSHTHWQKRRKGLTVPFTQRNNTVCKIFLVLYEVASKDSKENFSLSNKVIKNNSFCNIIGIFALTHSLIISNGLNFNYKFIIDNVLFHSKLHYSLDILKQSQNTYIQPTN